MKDKLTVYIAGPMTGREHYNVVNFEIAAEDWTRRGWTTVTPFDANSVVWRRHFDRPFDPYTDKCDYGDPILSEMLAEDFRVLCMADAVALLPGWRNSKGAKSEALVALNLGRTLYDAVTHDTLVLTPELSFVDPRRDAAPPPPETILEEAQRLVHGNRGADYGHPIHDYTRTGRIWGAILGIPDIEPATCCLMMGGVKISREVNKHKRDNLTDLAGYAECASMVAEYKEEF